MNQPAYVAKPRRRSIEEWAYDALGDEWCGNTVPPGDRLGVDLDCEQIAQTSNDGFELWIGTRNEWAWHCRKPDALRLAWFILWRWWAVGTWFGAKRAIWYWLLHRRCERHNAIARRLRDEPAAPAAEAEPTEPTGGGT